MRLTTTTDISKEYKQQLFGLWNRSYPTELVYENMSEFDTYLNLLENITHLLVQDEDDILLGWLMLFERDSLTQFAMIVHPEFKRKGLGRSLLNEAKKIKPELSGWVIESDNYTLLNGSAYISPVRFYLANGFSVKTNENLPNSPIKAVRIHWKIPFSAE